MELLLTGDMASAREAERIGLIQGVTEGDVGAYARELARKIIAKGTMTVNYLKSAVQKGSNMEQDQAIAYEASLFGLCFTTEDQKEGMSAFLGKRKPAFKGRRRLGYLCMEVLGWAFYPKFLEKKIRLLLP